MEAGPPECVGAGELGERLAALPQMASSTQAIEIGVEIRADEPTGYVADVVVQSKGRGTQLRSVATASSSCRELDDALLVVIDALVTGATLEDPPPERPVVPIPPTSTASTTSERRKAPPRVRASSRGRVSPAAFLGMTAELGALPSANAAARLEARLPIGVHPAIRFGLGTTPWASSRALETASMGFRLTSGRILGCWDFVAARWGYLDACAGFDAGIVTTTSDGLSAGSMTARPAAWSLAAAGMGVAFGPLVPELSAFVGPALARDSYRATDTSGVPHTVYRTEALRWGAGLALGVHFR